LGEPLDISAGKSELKPEPAVVLDVLSDRTRGCC
jgi:hypothetical protein